MVWADKTWNTSHWSQRGRQGSLCKPVSQPVRTGTRLDGHLPVQSFAPAANNTLHLISISNSALTRRVRPSLRSVPSNGRRGNLAEPQLVSRSATSSNHKLLQLRCIIIRPATYYTRESAGLSPSSPKRMQSCLAVGQTSVTRVGRSPSQSSAQPVHQFTNTRLPVTQDGD